jgi:hypothetical protein
MARYIAIFTDNHNEEFDVNGFKTMTEREVENFENFDPSKITKEDDLFLILSARKQTVSYDFHIDALPKTLSKNSDFTSFAIFYPELSKALSSGRISDITVPAFEQNIEKVRQLTEKITGIFKKGQEDENKDAERT